MWSSLVLALALGGAREARAARLDLYPTPPGGLQYAMRNDTFTVRVRQPGGPWRDLFEYDVTIDADGPSNASVVQFDFEGTVEIGVRKNNGDFRRSRSVRLTMRSRRRSATASSPSPSTSRKTCRSSSTATGCAICTFSPARRSRDPGRVRTS
ncbi:hypothetical protein ACRAWD_19885 [Caulobacter segnis]